MKISIYETIKLLKGNQTFTQLGFSMLLARLRNQYTQDSSEACLRRCSDEINAFLSKFVKVMAKDLESIFKLVKTEDGHQILTFEETNKMIQEGRLLHISGSEQLLRRLPRGNWIGGSTEFFISDEGGLVSGELLFVTEFPFTEYKFISYDEKSIKNIANDAYEYGFSLLVMPCDCPIHQEYAEHASTYENLFMRNIVGWVTCIGADPTKKNPLVVNGQLLESYSDKAVVLHIEVPEQKSIEVNTVNIFDQDVNSPAIEFISEGFTVENCLIDGEERNLAEYVLENKIDTQLPLVGDYSGHGINISFNSVENGVVKFFAPVFKGITYRIAKNIEDYEAAFQDKINKLSTKSVAFSCNCILNFRYGRFEGKKTEGFTGPVTFGEIAYQLLNQTLVYVTIQE